MSLSIAIVLLSLALGTIAAFAAWPTESMCRFVDRARRFAGLSSRLPMTLSEGPLAGWTIHTGTRPCSRVRR